MFIIMLPRDVRMSMNIINFQISENGVLFLCYGQAQAAIKSFQHDPSKPLSSLQMASAGMDLF